MRSRPVAQILIAVLGLAGVIFGVSGAVLGAREATPTWPDAVFTAIIVAELVVPAIIVVLQARLQPRAGGA